MEVTCQKCGTSCEVEEAKSMVYVAWCYTCDEYATTDQDPTSMMWEHLMEEGSRIDD